MPEPNALPKDAIRDASTVVLVRREGGTPRVLMGQRGRSAAFMPSKFVFPGGAVDRADSELAPHISLPATLAARLERRAPAGLAPVLALAAIREVWEEAGLAIADMGSFGKTAVPQAWQGFFHAGYRPGLARLELIFRAVTPPGRPRRFDARFFLVDADDLPCDPDDFSRADDELAHLSWLTLSEARQLDLPFITEIVLAEVESRLAEPDPGRPAPFFHHAEGRSFIDAL